MAKSGEVCPAKPVEQTLMNMLGVGGNYQIIVEEVDEVKDVWVQRRGRAWCDRLHGGEGAKRSIELLAAGGRRLPHWRAAQDGGEGAEGVL
jgi:hypothetical protein